MPHVSDTRFLVAHGLRLKGFAGAPALASLFGLDEGSVTGHLEELRTVGHAQYRDGRVTGWSLTADGRADHATACAEELARAGCEDAIGKAYERFVDRNQPLLQLCTDWQLIAGTERLNEHTDPAYDDAVVARLASLHTEVEPVTVDLASELSRFSAHGVRLAAARAKVESGEREWFTGAMIESYHTVWFELHEDLLTTLGIERSKEGN